MIDKGEVIKHTFLNLGENTIYNDNKNDLYKICEIQLEKVVSNIAYSTAFLFNAITVKLTHYGNIDDEYKFNIPIDCLNIVRCNHNYRTENEFIYSEEPEIKMLYCRRIDLTEIPANLFDLIVAMTAREMCFAVNTYNKRLEKFEAEVLKLKNAVVSQQGFLYQGDEL